MAIRYDLVREDARQVVQVWKGLSGFQLNDMSLASLESRIAMVDTLRTSMLGFEQEYERARIDFQRELAIVWDACVRARLSMAGHFGRDSAEYSLAGGTRLVDRKRRSKIEPSPNSTN